MTSNSKRKKQIRALMALHEETYTQASRRLAIEEAEAERSEEQDGG